MTNKRVQYTEGTTSQPLPNPTTGLQYLRRNAGNTAWELVTVTPGGGTASLGTTLAVGNTTDGYDIILSVGDALTSADGYVNISGHLSVSNGIDASNKKITSAADPTSAQDVSTKNYVDNHIIQLTSSAPADIDKSAAVVGTATTSARADHKHNISTASAGSIGASNTEGSATTLARSDHAHAVTDLRFSSQAKGDVLYFNGSNWVVLAPGADGYVLTTHSTGQNPTWEESVGGATVSNTAPLDVTKSTALSGTSSFAARDDHKHNVSTATAVSIGATNAEGTSTNLARADHTHAVTDLSIASEAQGDVLYFNGSNWVRLAAGTDGYQLTTHSTGQNPTWEYSLQVRNVLPANITKSAALSGTSAFAAKEDHKHDISTATAVSIGATNAEGIATTLARSDHTHAVTDLSIASEAQGDILYFNGSNWVRLAAGTDGYALTTHSTGQNPTWSIITPLTSSLPADITKSSALTGTSAFAARSDHKHNVATTTAVSIGNTNAEGSATTLARSDHTHAVTDLSITSEVQGSVLYFNGSNWVQLAPGQDGYVLTTHSTGQNPTWNLVSSGGGNANLTNTPPANITKSTALVGVAIDAARADHKHDISTASAGSIGATNAEGSATTLARSDHTHAVTDLSIASEAQGDILYFNGSNWVRLAAGTDGYQLTTHSTGQNPTWSGTTLLTNSLPADTTKSNALVGVSGFAARDDHKHNVSTATAVSIGATSAEGVATTLARSDHTHAVTDLSITSQAQGSVLYYNGSNWVQLAPGQDGYVLTTHSTGQNPTWTLVSGGGGGTATNLSITGQTQGSVLYYNGTIWTQLAPGQDGYVLTTHGSNANPTWTMPIQNSNIITPPALTGSVNNYFPTGFFDSNIIRLDGGGADRSFTGFQAPGKDMIFTLINIGTTNSFTFVANSASSAVGNRILGSSNGAPGFITAGGAGTFWYDTVSLAWRQIGLRA